MDLEPDTVSSGSLKRRSGAPSLLPLDGNEAEDDEVYGASHFGQFGEYMRRKRAKLQIQNAVLAQTEDSGIFRGLSIYVEYYLRVPSFLPTPALGKWLDRSICSRSARVDSPKWRHLPALSRQKVASVSRFMQVSHNPLLFGNRTHVITCSLTPAKLREFKNMKVVIPGWIVDSVKRGKLLPWQDYKYSVQNRTELTQGEQRTLSSFNVRHSSSTSGPGDAIPIDVGDPVQASSIQAQDKNDKIPYAAESSNSIAQKALADPNWRRAHTSAAPDFVEGYYRNSRLHYLSTWKAELRSLIVEAQEQAEKAENLFSTEVSGGSVAEPSAATSHASDLGISNADLGVVRPSSREPGPSAMAELAPETKTAFGVLGSTRESADDQIQRVIMHCDFDCFFVSVGLTTRPHLRGKPVVVCHSQGTQGGASSTSEVASASYEAREQGVKNGMR